MPKENTATVQEPQLAEDQLLEWGNTPLKSEDRVEEEEVEEDESTDEVKEVEENEDSEENEDESNDEEEDNEVEELPAQADVEDPGEYVPKDYSFTVEVEGKTHKLSTPEEATAFADENADKMTAQQLLRFMRSADKMESNLERDKEAYEAEKAKFEEQRAAQEQQQSTIQNIANEITYLVGKGKLPKVDPKYGNADWSDPEVAKQPGVKEQVELLNYMRTENDARTKAGLAPLTSALDAFNAMELERRDSSDEDEETKAANARKKAGSRVAGTSPKPVNVAPKGIAVGRALGSLSDLDSFN